MKSKALEVKDLTKEIAGRVILDGACISVGKNQVASISGPTGSGKTTLLRVIAGLDIPQKGTISISDDVVYGGGVNVKPSKRGISMLFQGTALWPHMTCGENISYCMGSDSEYMDKVVDSTKCTHLLGRYPSTLSGGELQQVALARALVQKPKVLLLDEPMSNVDKDLKKALAKIITKSVKEFRITSLYVTHDMSEAKKIADRRYELKSGRLKSRK